MFELQDVVKNEMFSSSNNDGFIAVNDCQIY